MNTKFIKSTYISPKTIIEKISLTSSVLVFSAYPENKKDYGSEGRCPFNHMWCIDKQNRLDEWRNTVGIYAKEHKNYTFHTRGDMFDGCPHDYTELCAKYEQKQRG